MHQINYYEGLLCHLVEHITQSSRTLKFTLITYGCESYALRVSVCVKWRLKQLMGCGNGHINPSLHGDSVLFQNALLCCWCEVSVGPAQVKPTAILYYLHWWLAPRNHIMCSLCVKYRAINSLGIAFQIDRSDDNVPEHIKIYKVLWLKVVNQLSLII